MRIKTIPVLLFLFIPFSVAESAIQIAGRGDVAYGFHRAFLCDFNAGPYPKKLLKRGIELDVMFGTIEAFLVVDLYTGLVLNKTRRFQFAPLLCASARMLDDSIIIKGRYYSQNWQAPSLGIGILSRIILKEDFELKQYLTIEGTTGAWYQVHTRQSNTPFDTAAVDSVTSANQKDAIPIHYYCDFTRYLKRFFFGIGMDMRIFPCHYKNRKGNRWQLERTGTVFLKCGIRFRINKS